MATIKQNAYDRNAQQIDRMVGHLAQIATDLASAGFDSEIVESLVKAVINLERIPVAMSRELKGI